MENNQILNAWKCPSCGAVMTADAVHECMKTEGVDMQMTTQEIIELLNSYNELREIIYNSTKTEKTESTIIMDNRIANAITALESRKNQKTVEDVKEFCKKRIESCGMVKNDFKSDNTVQETMWHRIEELGDLIDFIETPKEEIDGK